MLKLRKITKEKKGVLGLDDVSSVLKSILVLAVLAFAAIIAMSTLKGSNVLTAGSSDYNQTQGIFDNVTAGISQFFGNAPTFFAIMAAVVILLMIVLILVAVNRFGSGSGTRI